MSTIRIVSTTELADRAAEREILLHRIKVLEEEVARLSVRQPAGPLGDVYFFQCSKCQREKQIDISPARVLENHTMQLAEDEHRARIHRLASPEADRARAVALAEQMEAAEERARARTRGLRAEAAQDRADLTALLTDGPWANQNDSGGRPAPSRTGWGD